MSALSSTLHPSEVLPRLLRRLRPAPVSLPDSVARQIPRIVDPVASLPPVRRLASAMMINYYAYATSLRPRALTLERDYTTWGTLTDRSFTGRHLPPADAPTMDALPPEPDVAALFRRER
jgi:prostaglandin-endoperoxide synthase 2